MAFDTRLLGGLRVLAAVVESGSFVRAGQGLGLTQSAVSRAVQRLEAHLGLRLLERTSRSVALTDDGRRFYDAVLPLLEQLQQSVEQIGESAAQVRGRLRVNVEALLARLVLAPRIGEFIERHPGITVELEAREELGDLVADGCDVALRFGEPHANGLVARKLRDLQVITCAAESYLARRGRPKHPRDLVRDGHECILLRDPATRRPYAWEFHRGRKVVAVPVRGRLLVNDGMTYLAACSSGLGFAQMFDWNLAQTPETRGLVNVFPDWPDERYPIYLVYRSGRHVSPKVKAFVDFVAEIVREG